MGDLGALDPMLLPAMKNEPRSLVLEPTRPLQSRQQSPTLLPPTPIPDRNPEVWAPAPRSLLQIYTPFCPTPRAVTLQGVNRRCLV